MQYQEVPNKSSQRGSILVESAFVFVLLLVFFTGYSNVNEHLYNRTVVVQLARGAAQAAAKYAHLDDDIRYGRVRRFVDEYANGIGLSPDEFELSIDFAPCQYGINESGFCPTDCTVGDSEKSCTKETIQVSVRYVPHGADGSNSKAGYCSHDLAAILANDPINVVPDHWQWVPPATSNIDFTENNCLVMDMP